MKNTRNMTEIAEIFGVPDAANFSTTPVFRAALKCSGWCNRFEALALYCAAYSSRTGAIVEIGTYKAKSTKFLILGNKEGPWDKRLVYAIDPFISSTSGLTKSAPSVAEAVATLQEFDLADRVAILPTTSLKAARLFLSIAGHVDVLFIDGHHSYESVSDDFGTWLGLVQPGGWIMFHDSYQSKWPGVAKLLGEIKTDSRVEEVALVSSLSIWRVR